MNLFSDVKAIFAKIEADAAAVGAEFHGETTKVEAALSPVLTSFIQQAEAIAKQIGGQAFSALVAEAKTVAAALAANTTLTGPQKFEAFMAQLTAWAKAEAPAVEALAGPAFRALLEMTIAAATVAATGGSGAAVAVAAGAAGVAVVTAAKK